MQNDNAKDHINEIRRNLFVSNESQRERQDRSIGILTNELYSSFGRVLLELLQNADDSNFDENQMHGLVPQIYVLLRWDCLIVHINEMGMTRSNVESVCDIGNSSKKNTNSRFFTGEKGIGYRSLFKITENPGIYSGGYSIRFSSNPDDEIGLRYIVPKWEEQEDFPDVVKSIHNNILKYGVPWIEKQLFEKKIDFHSNGTIHYLPFGNERKLKFRVILSAIHEIFVPDLLLFLRNIKSIVIDVEPRKESKFCSDGQNTLFPLLRRRLSSNKLYSISNISNYINDNNLEEQIGKNNSEKDSLSLITGFSFVNVEVRQFDEDDLDKSKNTLLKESVLSSNFMVVDWNIPISNEFKLEGVILRDRITRTYTQWSIAFPLLHANFKLELNVSKDKFIKNSSVFSLGSSTFGKHKRVIGKLFCTFPINNRLHLPFHVNIQDLILTANREDFLADNKWNSTILNMIFNKQIPDFLASIINSEFSCSDKVNLINQKYDIYIDKFLKDSGIFEEYMESIISDHNSQYYMVKISDLLKFSWLPIKTDDSNSLSSNCINSILKRPLFLKIDGSFGYCTDIVSYLQIPDLCSRSKHNNETFCKFCNLHWEFLDNINNHIKPLLHPTLLSGFACFHFSNSRVIQILQLLITQSINSYGVKKISISDIFCSIGTINFLNSISDNSLIILYGYILFENEIENLSILEDALKLPIIPTNRGKRIAINVKNKIRVCISDDLFKSYWNIHNLEEYSVIINKLCPIEFFDEIVYNTATLKIKRLIEEVFKIEKITPFNFFTWIAEEADALIEKGWESAIDKDIHRLLLKITPLAIEEGSSIDIDNRSLMKLPVVVQTYSPSFLKALMYNKDPPKSYANEQELNMKDKLAKCSLQYKKSIFCEKCDILTKEEMIEPVSVALRMSQVSKSLTTLMSLYSDWERSNKLSSRRDFTNKLKLNEKSKEQNTNIYPAFEYKGLTIVPPLWPPLVEWVFPKVCDRFHFVELSPEYIIEDSSETISNVDNLTYRSFMNKFINLLEQWYIGCNFDRLPPKTDASPLSWMTDHDLYPLNSSNCFYCKHLLHMMRASAIIQIANEYSRRSYNSSFLNEILSSYSWIPISLSNEYYYSTLTDKNYNEEINKNHLQDQFLLEQPSELFIPDINKELNGMVKYISRTILKLLPVKLRNGYKIQIPRDNNENLCSTKFILSRSEEDIGNELKLIIETLEKIGVTTQISSISLIKLLKDIKNKMNFNKFDKTNLNISFMLADELEIDHITEFATFGFGISKNKLIQSDWWITLKNEWMNIGKTKQNTNTKSNVDILSDIYQLIGQQTDFDISIDIKKIFYTDSLLYLPLMKSPVYNWVNIDYNKMIWSDPYDFFHGTFIVLNKYIKKDRIKGLRSFFLSLISEQPIHQHYAYLWLNECPNLLKDESKEGKIKFESFINVAINKFSTINQKINTSKKPTWWQNFFKEGKIPIKGINKFYDRDNCCVEDIPFGNFKHELFKIPLALTSTTNSQSFFKDIFKVKTITECYKLTYKITKKTNSNYYNINKTSNKLWLTLEFWGTLLLLFKHKSLDIYLSIMKILKDKNILNESKENSDHINNNCIYCVSQTDLDNEIKNIHEYKTVSLKEKNLSQIDEKSSLITDWFVTFINTYEVEVDNIELEFELKKRKSNLPKKSKTNMGVLFKQIPNKKVSILFVNTSMDKTDQLTDLYKLLTDSLKDVIEINQIINIDLYELLILTTSQRLILLSKYIQTLNNMENNITCESINKTALNFLILSTNEKCLVSNPLINYSKQISNDLLIELTNNNFKNKNEHKYNNLDNLITDYLKSNLLNLSNDDKNMSIEEINKQIGYWGEKTSFEAILPNAISRKLALKSIESILIEDYFSKDLINNYILDNIYFDKDPDYIDIQNMTLEDNHNQNNKHLLKCKIKSFRESNDTIIKLIWLNSLNESFLPYDFVLVREYINTSSGICEHLEILSLIEVKATKLPIWQFNISASELSIARKATDKFKLLLIKDAGSSESQWVLIDNVHQFILNKCKLINGLFEPDFNNNDQHNLSGILNN